jgi:uncharacterized phage-associated protein
VDESYINFNREAFKGIVHYVCANVDPDALGNVKLHKIMYFADMMHFMSEGKPLTGVDYLKQQFGPVARHLSACLKELEREGLIRIETTDYYGFEKKRYVSKSEPAVALSDKQIDLLQEVIGFVRSQTARGISNFSHDLAWQLAEMGERIPYAAVYGWEPCEISDADRAEAIEEVRQLRPMMEEATRAGRVQ